MLLHRVLSALVIILLLPGLATAATWYVEKDGSGDYTVIQDALDAAASGDSVIIGPGWFEESRIYSTTGGDRKIYAKVEVENLTIIGSGTENTVLGPIEFTWQEPEPLSRGIHYIAQPISGALQVSELTIRNLNAGVYAENTGGLRLSDCSFVGGWSGVHSYVNTQVEGCIFQGFLNYGGISYSQADTVEYRNCEFQFSTGVGVQSQGAKYCIVVNRPGIAGDSIV